MAQINFSSLENPSRQEGQKTTNYVVKYFSLKSGEDAIVRFFIPNVETFNVNESIHQIQEGGNWKSICCLRNASDPVEKCPLCESGSKVAIKFPIKLINYVRDANGGVIAVPSVWNTTLTVAKKLKSYFVEYGDLTNQVFKIKRTGGGLDTTYDIIPANPMIYKPELYTSDFSAFDNVDVKKMFYLTKTYEEMKEMTSTCEPQTQSGITSSYNVASEMQRQSQYSQDTNKPRRYIY